MELRMDFKKIIIVKMVHFWKKEFDFSARNHHYIVYKKMLKLDRKFRT